MIVGSGGGAEHHLHCIGVNGRLAQQLLHGACHHVGCAGTLFGLQDVACLHTDALHYPLIGGIHDA